MNVSPRRLALLLACGGWLAASSVVWAQGAGAAPASASPSAAAPAPVDPTYALQDGRLVLRRRAEPPRPVETPCAAQALQRAGQRLYLACADAGLAVFELDTAGAPQLVEQRPLAGRAVGFLVAPDGRVWVELLRSEARPLDEAMAAPALAAAPAAAPAATPSAPSPGAPPPSSGGEGVVLEAHSGRVVIDLGQQHGLARGSHVALFTRRTVDLGGGQSAQEEDLIAVGEVRAVTADRAQVRLGLNERVPAGAVARRSEGALSETQWAPPRVDGIWEVAFMARPFLAVGAFGLGAIADGSVSLRHPDNLRLQLLLEPAGVGYADEGNILALAGTFLGSYDTRLFEIGLGLGWSLVNEDLQRSVAAGASDESGMDAIEPGFEGLDSGLAVGQIARLGATDGLHILVRNTFLLYDSTFFYGGTTGQLQWPVTESSWLLLRGGGGRAGYGYGEVGLRWLARGNGDRDSVFLTVTAGGGALSGHVDSTCRYYTGSDAQGAPVYEDQSCQKSISYGGPMVGFGAEWRL